MTNWITKKPYLLEKATVLLWKDGRHDNDATVYLANAICVACEKSKDCVCFDASEMEYTVMAFCDECWQILYSKVLHCKTKSEETV